MKFIKFLIIFMFFAYNQLNAQIFLTNLSENTKIIIENHKINDIKTIKNDTLQLPFVDDFSSSQIFPNEELWSNKYVFINGDYPINPYTINVATFDALDDSGRIYRNANTTSFIADSLTSRLIKIKNKQNVYFSFCYQPQGIGDAPDKNDSLVLEFYSDKNKTWQKVWSDTGTTYQRFYQRYQTSFKYVVIPVTDTSLYKETFKFRFYNYASLQSSSLPGVKSNCDQWHIDYIYLNALRNPTDTTFKDMAISKEGTSLLKNYYAMPWRQFKVNSTNEIKSNTDITICNLENISNSITFFYEIIKNNNIIYTLPPLNIGNINPYQFVNPNLPLSNVFSSDNNDNALFVVKKIIRDSSNNFVRSNDTIQFYQDFSNYYAYDDGNPEAGIGLTPANSKLALKFTLNTPDTLRAVQIYFNATQNNANQRNFKLMVWKSINPEVILYSKNGYIPVFGEDNNRYHYYRLENPLIVSDTFYVGIQQTTDDFLNIGFDYNNNSKDKAFCKYASNWEQVPYNGAIMMRPVLGSELAPNASINEIENSLKQLVIYPNPIKGSNLNIELPNSIDKTNIQVQIIDIYGRILYLEKYSNKINISSYPNGLYFIRLTNNNNKETFTSKVIITN